MIRPELTIVNVVDVITTSTAGTTPKPEPTTKENAGEWEF